MYNTFKKVTCFSMRSNMRMKQPRFMSSSSQSKSKAQWPVAWPRFLNGLQRSGLRNGLLKGLGNGLRVLCCPRRPGSDTTLTYMDRTHHNTIMYSCMVKAYNLILVHSPKKTQRKTGKISFLAIFHHQQVMLALQLLCARMLESCWHFFGQKEVWLHFTSSCKTIICSSSKILYTVVTFKLFL